MSIIAWVVVGLVYGFVASKVVSGSGHGPFTDMVPGVAGAVVGGFFFHLLGHTAVTRFSLWSLVASILGAVVLLGAYRAVSVPRSHT